jgi:transcriptional regulator with XRE-family HTH domain
MTRGRPPKQPTANKPAWAVRLKEARQRAGFSQQTLADRIVVSQSTIGGWEMGVSEPNLTTIERLAHACGVSPAWLVFGVGEPTEHNALAFAVLDRHKHDKLFTFAFHEAARLFAEEGLHADLPYLASYVLKLLRETEGTDGQRGAQQRILAALEAERTHIREELDAVLKNRL